MNKVTRQKIKEIVSELDKISDKLEIIMNDEQDKFDNLSDGLQCSPTGEAIEEAIDFLNDGISGVNTAIFELKNIC